MISAYVNQERGIEMAYDYTQDVNEAIAKERVKNLRPTILICGYTGSGKTTLIQKICGEDIVSTDKISDGQPCTKSFDFYENDFFRLFDSKGLEPGKNQEEEFVTNVKDLVRKLREDDNLDNHIHLIWYCIQGSGARVTDCDLRLIKNIFNMDHEIAVITKRDITRDNQYDAIKRILSDSGVPESRILGVSDLDTGLLTNLLEKSLELLPDARKHAFIAGQVLRLDKKKNQAQAIIHSNATAAAAIGAIPIPGSDAPLLAGLQTEMLVALAFNYGIPTEAIKTTFMPAIAIIVGTLTATSLIKLIPGLGSVVQAIIAAALTEAIGLTGNKYFISCAEAKLHGEPTPEFKFNRTEFENLFNSIRHKK